MFLFNYDVGTFLTFFPLSQSFFLPFFSRVILILVSHAANYSGKIESMQTGSHTCRMSCKELCLQAFSSKFMRSSCNYSSTGESENEGQQNPVAHGFLFSMSECPFVVWHTRLGRTDRKAHLLTSSFFYYGGMSHLHIVAKIYQ